MAFGPSVFDVSLSPILLVFLVAGIGAAGGAWYFFGRRRRSD
jgi:LPXTG-motif cell wall-anchored protein